MRANGNFTHEILGKIVTAIASIAMTAAFAVPAMAASDSGTAADPGTTQQSGQYKIYPQPQNTEYGDGSLILRDKANTVVEPGIDSATKARLNEALKLKGIETTAADAVPETAYQLNVLVGINGSNGVVDKYAKQLIADGTLRWTTARSPRTTPMCLPSVRATRRRPTRSSCSAATPIPRSTA